MTRKLLLILSICLVFILHLPVESWARAGGDSVENGGDAFASEFIMTARDALIAFGRMPPGVLHPMKINEFKKAISRTQVRTEDKLVLRGVEVDAINTPSQSLIRISRQRWNGLRREELTFSRIRLVVHEYLGIMGIADKNYELSQRLVSQMSPSKTNADQYWYPMNPTNSVWFRIVKPDGLCSAPLVQFDVTMASEQKEVDIPCGDLTRRVQVIKTESKGEDPDHRYAGTFHKFEIIISNSTGIELVRLEYTPDFGQCLLALDLCYQSGVMKLASVEFQFWLYPTQPKVLNRN